MTFVLLSTADTDLLAARAAGPRWRPAHPLPHPARGRRGPAGRRPAGRRPAARRAVTERIVHTTADLELVADLAARAGLTRSAAAVRLAFGDVAAHARH